MTVDDFAYAEACSKCVAEQVGVGLRAAELFDTTVDFGQNAAFGLAEGEEVAIIIDDTGSLSSRLRTGRGLRRRGRRELGR